MGASIVRQVNSAKASGGTANAAPVDPEEGTPAATTNTNGTASIVNDAQGPDGTASGSTTATATITP
jgi:hypothetical protein